MVSWWGAGWAGANILTGGAAPPSFKGFVDSVSLPNTSPPSMCGAPWTTAPGNSSSPVDSVPSYMGVIVASTVSREVRKLE